tara:strand:- start:2882 stop:6427 length:3546 start_codon:yes stop_codon:yes gene_type:complete
MLKGEIINGGSIVSGGKVFQQNAKLPKDALKSVDFITVVDILSEGEIELSATAHKEDITDKTTNRYKNAFLKDIFLNNQPVLAPDANLDNPAKSDKNYETVKVQFREGTANQTKLPGRALTPSTQVTEGDIGEFVSFPEGGTATTRSVTINNVDVDVVRVRVNFVNFFKIDSKGKRKATQVRVQIFVNPNNGNSQRVVNNVVKGKSTSSYNRDYGIRLKNLTGYNTNPPNTSGSFFPITVTLTRANDEGDSNTFNQMKLEGVTEIIEESHTYPHVAHSSLRFSAEEFPSLPSRIFRVRGKKVKIPHNATVERATGRITYSGSFNGSFKTDREWTSDPAWILYDLLVYNSERNANQQYGCELPEASIDKFVFQKASEYCGELVDDGQGGQEPRFSLNVNIRTQTEALKLINDICSVMRAMPFYSEGTIKISQDAPKDFTNPNKIEFDYIFNNANVVDGNFLYSGSSLKTRFTIINVSYFDLETQELDYETVKDTTAIQKYGEQIKTIRTFGTTSRGQAQRVGKWFLNTQQTATETCVFETNIAAGAVVQIGSIIGIADRVKGSSVVQGTNIVGKRRGGLVKAVGSSQGNSNIDQITIDNVDDTNQPDISDSPTISCLLSNGTVETRTISSYSNNQTVVNVSSFAGSTDHFSSAPVLNSPYIFESGNFAVTTWKVTNIKETNKKTYTIAALKHNQNKYAAVEDGTQLPTKPTNTLIETKLPPGDVLVEEVIEVINNRAVPRVFIDWEPVEGASGYQLQYRRDGDNFTLVNTQETTFDIVQSNFEAGSFDVIIRSVNALGEPSLTALERTFDLKGNSALPENPTNLELEPINNYQVRLSWDAAIALDVIHGGRCLIRHTAATINNAKFSDSTELDTQNGNTTDVIVPALAGTYTMKFEDLGGRLSPIEAKVEFALPETEDELVIKQQREQTAFSGNISGTSPNEHLAVVSGALELKNPATSLTGTYEFANILDLGAIYQNLRLKRHIKSEGFKLDNNFDALISVDASSNFDGEGSDRLKGRLKVQISNDNSSYTSFLNLKNGSFVGRYFKFKSELISVDANENIKFTELGFDASFPSRVENKYISSGNVISTPIQSGDSISNGVIQPTDVTFANRFFTGTSAIGGSTTAFTPVIGISPYNLDSGDYFVLSNVSGTGFTIIFKNSSDSPIDVKFSFQALGYGKGA